MAHDSYDGPVVAVGASAGGIDALRDLASRLPEDLDAPILVAAHVASTSSVVPQLITSAGPHEARHAVDGEVLVPGTIFVAPPDRHLVVHDGRLRVTAGLRENGFRPSVDTLFRSAAREADGGTIGIVLSGMLDDGAYGLRVITRGGGVGLVQDPETAAFPGMPQAAIEAGGASCVLPLQDIAERLSDIPALLAHHGAGREASGRGPSDEEPWGEVSSHSCPNCGGALWEHDDGYLRFRCRTGHAYSPESLLDVQAAALDDALWGAYRALLERAEVGARLAGRFGERDLSSSAERWADIGAEAQRRASLLRDVLSHDGPMPALGDAAASTSGELPSE